MAKKRQQFTFEDVKKTFQEKGVELLSEEIDQNKRVYVADKFLMKTKICNHEKTIRFGDFQQDKGHNYCQLCYQQQRRIKYSQILELFQKQECDLLVTEQEYNCQKLNSSTRLNCIGNCGHQCKMSYFDLLNQDCTKKQICKKCAGKDIAQKRCQTLMEKNLQLAKKICAEKNLQYISSFQEKKGNYVYVLKCPENHQFSRKIGELTSGQQCNVCTKYTGQQQNISIGDYHEQCVFNMVRQNCKTIEIVGNTGNLYDIIYTLDDNIKRGIQVRSLTKKKYKDNIFGCSINRSNGNCYPQNTIMVLINQQYDRFLVDMSQNFISNSIYVNFSSKKDKFYNTKFSDQNLFLQRLISLLPKSTQIDTKIQYSNDILKEIDCFERLQKKCQELGLSFQRSTTNGSSIDAYINNKPVQIKYRGLDFKQNSIYFNLRKNGGRKNGKETKIPYNYKDDVQFFIFEYGGQNGKYLSNFCILSKEFLIQQKYISTTDSKGKTGISVWKPDTTSDKDKSGRKAPRTILAHEFWNNFDQLQ